MAFKSKIAWTDSTWNGWIGCTKVSDGCKFCYAEQLMDKRWGKAQWGPQGERIRTTKSYWTKPIQWNQNTWYECTACHTRGIMNGITRCPVCLGKIEPARQRVFAFSLGDVFEDHPKQKYEFNLWRLDFFELIEQTPNIDWLLLTKRPENIETMLPDHWITGAVPKNIWWGTSVENQEAYNERVPVLADFVSRIGGLLWLSVEPMLGPVNISNEAPEIDWLVVGGESQFGCRTMSLDWARDLRKQSIMHGIKFFMKQLGGHPNPHHEMTDFPRDLRVREFPTVKHG